MTDITSPAGRLVQGSVAMQQRIDMTTRQKQWLDAAKTIPDMGLFFSVAFPKLVNGQPNAEFAKFYGELGAIAQAAWPQFFSGGACTNPKFSMKVVDGDGRDQNGQSVADKPGFKGHYIVKFDSNYGAKCFYEGKWSPQEEIGLLPNTPQPKDIIKRGYWIRVVCEAKSNNADLTKQQVPGISIYPKLISFLGGRPEDEISSGPDAAAAFGGAPLGWRPDGVSAVPGAPVGGLALPSAGGGGLALPGAGGGGGLALPTPPAVAGLALPGLAAPVAVAAAPQYVVRADLAQQGHTLDGMMKQGHTIEALVAAGYVTAAAPVALPAVGGGLALPGLVLPAAGGLALPAAGPRYQLTQKALDAVPGATIESLTAPGNGWTVDMLVGQGYAIKIG